MSLDTQPWMENGQAIRLTQDQWTEKYNQAGKVMASAPDFYASLKGCDDAFVAALREDFNNWLALSTRLRYNSDNLEGKIIHYQGSTVIDPIETDLVIPIFRDTPIEEAIVSGQHAEQGLAYLQAYFGTQDSAQDIIQNLERVSGKSRNQIKVWTANTSGSYTRTSHPDRAAFVGFNVDDFHVDGYGGLDYIGRSRGVSAGGAWLAPGKATADPESSYDIQSGISRKHRSVHFSNTQQIGDYERYDGLFCFEGDRYVISLLRRNGVNKRIREDNVAQVLAGKGTTDDKVGLLSQLNPTYVHIVKYRDGVKVDDSEGFKSLKD